jgi:hypothetical protein
VSLVGKKIGTMKTKLILLITLLAALLLVGCAAKFKEFRSEAGNFSVKAPLILEEQPQTIDMTSGKVEAHTYLAESDGILYVAAYSVFREEIINQGNPEELLNNARDSMLASLSGKLVLETRKSLEDYPGRELAVDMKMSDGTDGVMKARIYLVKNRLYQVMVLADKEDEDAGTITRFLDSFKLIGEK